MINLSNAAGVEYLGKEKIFINALLTFFFSRLSLDTEK